MLFTEREQLRHKIMTLADSFNNERSAVLQILQEIQTEYGYISSYAMQITADILHIHPVEVYSVVSFYEFLSDVKSGNYVISLSDCIAHDSAKKQAIARQLSNDLGIDFGETTDDGLFTLKKTGCIGMCDQGPVVLVNERIYTQFSFQDVGRIIDDCRKNFVFDSVEVKS
ncbi:MAG: NAD(P)H-dependent oxidoreductase subunit E [Deltaproteobacteria bacterium]|jgi:[NiFe] hydrogenase diaphorase moiety large subunit|nr:NAD(P)H-dependent oxidoreductase subunit E [Deltaproteobacteria bacterium]